MVDDSVPEWERFWRLAVAAERRGDHQAAADLSHAGHQAYRAACREANFVNRRAGSNAFGGWPIPNHDYERER
jgi:hypothetical protein